MEVIRTILKKYKYLIFFCVMFFFIISIKNNILKNNYKTCFGKMIQYNNNGSNNLVYLEYKFECNSKTYTRSITPSINYDQCNNYINICDHMNFLVIYYEYFPYLNLIDLHQFYDDKMNPDSIPINLDNFE